MGLASIGGEEKVTLSGANIPPHSHDVKIQYREGSENGSGNDYSDLGSPTPTNTKTVTSENWGGQNGQTISHENMPPFYTINFIIKAK